MHTECQKSSYAVLRRKRQAKNYGEELVGVGVEFIIEIEQRSCGENSTLATQIFQSLAVSPESW